jgi:SAM-dependent methyltransferase
VSLATERAACRAASELPAAHSVTHVHLLACVLTELARRDPPAGATLRILDAGCGDGRFLAYLDECLTRLRPQWTVEPFGFDVIDHGVQPQGFIDRAVGQLAERRPALDWSDRIRAIRASDPWPFEDAGFDLVLSNQVLEHVQDPARFLGEVRRVLVQGGASLHLFPLKHYIHEGHLLLPWVHRIRSHDLRRGYITFLSRLGLGKFRQHHRDTGVSLATFAERHADYMAFWTHYLSEAEALEAARRAGLRASFRYTSGFYAQKLRSLARRPPGLHYATGPRGLWDSLSVKLLRYVSSVTLTLHKENRY